MNWNDHSDLKGRHALYSPSSCDYIGHKDDCPEDMYKRRKSFYAAAMGTALHEYAEDRIRYKLRLAKSSKNDVLLHLLKSDIPRDVIDIDFIYENYMNYVNDAIGYRMDPEIALYYSDAFFGHADSICFTNDKGKKVLRIHDYKSGVLPARMKQLKQYAALFFLEYKVNPSDVDIILRLYQVDNEVEEIADVNEIREIMDIIIDKTKMYNEAIGRCT